MYLAYQTRYGYCIIMYMVSRPTDCIVAKPNGLSVKFGGVPISLSAICRLTDIDLSHLSRIFSGKRQPSTKASRRIAEALEMTLEDFLDTLDSQNKPPTDLDI